MAKALLKEELNRQQKKFVKQVARTNKIGQSALAAGFSDPHYGSYLMRQPQIQSALQVEMEKIGITDEFLAKKLKHGLNAYYPPKKEGGRKYPDFFTRNQYMKDVLKVRGDLKDRQEIDITKKQIVVMITPEMTKGLLDSGAINKEEAQEIIEHEPIEDEDGKDSV